MVVNNWVSVCKYFGEPTPEGAASKGREWLRRDWGIWGERTKEKKDGEQTQGNQIELSLCFASSVSKINPWEKYGKYCCKFQKMCHNHPSDIHLIFPSENDREFRNFQHLTVRSIFAVIAKQTTQNWSELPFIFQLKSAIQQLHFCCFSVWKPFGSILPPSSIVEESSSCFKLPQVSSLCWKWRRISDISHSLASHTTAPLVSRMSLNASLEIEVFSKTTQYN